MHGVHVWRANLSLPPTEVATLHELLDPVERSRAAKFRNERDRRRFIVARATLRILLGDYIDRSPRDVPLHVLPEGKPALDREVESAAPRFNVSHCGELALFAFADREVGIDVERLAAHDDMSSVAAHFFSPEEADVFGRAAEEDRTRLFYRTWVRKEAYLKATGSGLAIDPASASVADSYEVHDLADIDGHVAAIALAPTP